MAWIPMVPEAEAAGELRQLYERLIEPSGGVDHILKIHSLSPASLAAHYELYRVIMRGASPLTRPQREMIAVTVSGFNDCHY